GTETGKTTLNETTSPRPSMSTPKAPQVLIDASAEDLENEHDVTINTSTLDPDQEVILDTDFGLQWVDWKIVEHLSNSSSSNGKINFQHRTFDSTVLRHIWKPDIFIDEMSSAERTSVISNLITLNFLDEKGGGDIVYSARTTLKLRCNMSFEYFPADTQTCKYYIRSYSYNASQFDIMWNVYNGSISKGIYLNDPEDPNFDLQISCAGPNGEAKLYIREMFDDFRNGNYSALTFTLKMRRKLSYHLVQTYLPSVLLILITWLCFLLPVDMVEARIAISMTTGLTLTAMFASVREQSPTVSYPMAIDIWMVFCIFFVFLGLLLFTTIYWMTRHLGKYEEEQATTPNYKKLIMDFIQRYAFVAFAAIFIAFFIIYWSCLLLLSDYYGWEPNPDYNGGDDAKNNTNLYSYFTTAEDEYAKLADES
ncbi:Glycine receptor subunit alpha-2, partial [Folsomia candida]